jgi:hypothetical protein
LDRGSVPPPCSGFASPSLLLPEDGCTGGVPSPPLFSSWHCYHHRYVASFALSSACAWPVSTVRMRWLSSRSRRPAPFQPPPVRPHSAPEGVSNVARPIAASSRAMRRPIALPRRCGFLLLPLLPHGRRLPRVPCLKGNRSRVRLRFPSPSLTMDAPLSAVPLPPPLIPTVPYPRHTRLIFTDSPADEITHAALPVTCLASYPFVLGPAPNPRGAYHAAPIPRGCLPAAALSFHPFACVARVLPVILSRSAPYPCTEADPPFFSFCSRFLDIFPSRAVSAARYTSP